MEYVAIWQKLRYPSPPSSPLPVSVLTNHNPLKHIPTGKRPFTSPKRDVNGIILLLFRAAISLRFQAALICVARKNGTHLGRETGPAKETKHRKTARATPNL